jgi:hypothetical protein
MILADDILEIIWSPILYSCHNKEKACQTKAKCDKDFVTHYRLKFLEKWLIILNTKVITCHACPSIFFQAPLNHIKRLLPNNFVKIIKT